MDVVLLVGCDVAILIYLFFPFGMYLIYGSLVKIPKSSPLQVISFSSFAHKQSKLEKTNAFPCRSPILDRNNVKSRYKKTPNVYFFVVLMALCPCAVFEMEMKSSPLLIDAAHNFLYVNKQPLLSRDYGGLLWRLNWWILFESRKIG